MKEKNLTSVERVILDRYDAQIVYALLRADDAGWCELSDEFVAIAYERGGTEIKSFIKDHVCLVSDLVLDKIFAEKDAEYLKRYLNETQGRYMQYRHIIALIRMGDQELTDYFFALYAPLIWEDSSYVPVVYFLREYNLDEDYRKKYLPKRTFAR